MVGQMQLGLLTFFSQPEQAFGTLNQLYRNIIDTGGLQCSTWTEQCHQSPLVGKSLDINLRMYGRGDETIALLKNHIQIHAPE